MARTLMQQRIYFTMENALFKFQDMHYDKKVQVGNDQEKAQSEKDSHSKNRGGKKLN